MSSASSASRILTTNGRPRKSSSALDLPIRSEAPAASTTPATPIPLHYRELHPAAKPPNWRRMAVRHIRQLGDPILRVRCERVQNPKSAATRLIADDLRDSLAAAKKKYKMGRALAAPQIGAPVRIVFVQMDKQRWTMINPEITDVGPNDFLVWDDCFSFPELLVRVTRAHAVTVSYTDLKGKQRTMEAEGPMAELLQHEIDHLDGILALDRPSGVDPFAFRVEWEKLHPPEERYGPPKPREV
ncbi:MAG: peptide deformylase [Gemmatimonadetes bacterium]|nr:MAG: peptide deformylase [Gemmatimonadota bacterium]